MSGKKKENESHQRIHYLYFNTINNDILFSKMLLLTKHDCYNTRLACMQFSRYWKSEIVRADNT